MQTLLYAGLPLPLLAQLTLHAVAQLLIKFIIPPIPQLPFLVVTEGLDLRLEVGDDVVVLVNGEEFQLQLVRISPHTDNITYITNTPQLF